MVREPGGTRAGHGDDPRQVLDPAGVFALVLATCECWLLFIFVFIGNFSLLSFCQDSVRCLGELCCKGRG